MVASYNKLRAQLKARTYVHDVADATVATKLAWVPMTEYFLALLTLISGTGVLTFKIFAATDGVGTGAVEVKAHANPTPADAAGDQLALEVTAEEVKAALNGATHVAVEVDMDAATDICAVTYIQTGGRFGYGSDALTGDVIS